MKLTAALLALLLAACAPVQTAPPPADSSASGIHFTVERLSSSAMRLALDNGSPHPIGYNLCSSQLQRRSGSEWTLVPTDEICTMELRTLSPGHDATFEKRLPATLTAGEYRYDTNVQSSPGGAMVRLATDPFTVQ